MELFTTWKELTDWITWEGVKEVGFTIAGVFTFWITFWKSAGKKMYLHYKNGRNARWALLMEVQKGQNVKIDKIIMQLYPNGGSSLFDKVDRILDYQQILKDTNHARFDLDNTPIMKTDADGKCTFCNLAWLKLVGLNSPDEAKGLGYLRVIHPQDRDRVFNEYVSAIKTGTQYVSTYRKVNQVTKQPFEVTKMARIIRNSKGDPVEVIGVVQKIDNN